MNTTEITLKMVFDRWYALIKNFDTTLNELTDEQLQKEIAPGKNRGIYLLGHMIAVHDDMLRLLDLGDKMHPELFEPFITSPDKTVSELPSSCRERDLNLSINDIFELEIGKNIKSMLLNHYVFQKKIPKKKLKRKYQS